MLQVYCLEVDTQGVYLEKQKRQGKYAVESQIRQGGILLRGRKDKEVYC